MTLFKLRGSLIWILAWAVVSGCSADPQRAAQKYLSSGDGYLSEGRLAEAVIEYRNAVQQDPASADARVKLGQALVQAGDLGSATTEFVRAADLSPAEAGLQVTAGSFLLIDGKAEDARDRAERALANDPEHIRGHLLLAGALAGLQNLDAAVEAVERAIEIAPTQGEPYVALGSLQLQLGQRERALEALRSGVEVDPESSTSRLALARFFWVSGELDAAESEFLEAVERQPAAPLTNQAMADFYVATNRLDDAEPYLRAVMTLTEAPDARLRVASLYARTGRPDEAAALLEPLAQQPLTAAQATVQLAAIEHAAGRASEAHERLTAAIKSSTNLPALLLSSELLLRDGRLDEALERATSAIEADPREGRAHALIGRIRAERGDASGSILAYEEALRLRPGDGTVTRELGRLYLQAGDVDRALRFAEEAVTARPSDLQGRLLLAGALLATGQHDDRAAVEIAQLVATYPQSAPVRVQEGILAARQGRAADGRRAFERALALDPHNASALSGLIGLDFASRDLDAARARVTEWLDESPDDPGRLLLAARVLGTAGDVAGAEHHLRRVVELDPANLAAYADLGQLYFRQNRLEDARREFDTLAERSPTPAGALTMAGILLDAQGRTVDARDRFERAVQHDPEAAVAANNLAWSYADAGERLDRALELAQLATSLLPDLAQTNDTLGWVHYKRNLPALAIPFFRRSIEIDPTNEAYQFHLGLAHAEAGDAEAAREALERALEMRPDFVGADEANKVLERLSSREG